MRTQFFRIRRRFFFLTIAMMHGLSHANQERAAFPDPDWTLPAPEASVILIVAGNITRTNTQEEAHFDEHMLQALPAHTLHTQTVVTDGRQRFDGPLMRDLLGQIGAQGNTVRAIALNNYSVDIPMRDFYDFDVMLATHMNGERLSAHNKGPIWIVYPRDQHRKLQDIRYDYRWVWQLQQLIVQ